MKIGEGLPAAVAPANAFADVVDACCRMRTSSTSLGCIHATSRSGLRLGVWLSADRHKPERREHPTAPTK